MTPAFSPMPASSRSVGGAFSPNWRRCTLLDLYEQCSLHMIEYIASSDCGRPAAEDLPDPLVLVVLEAQLGVRLELVGVVSARSTVSGPPSNSSTSTSVAA